MSESEPTLWERCMRLSLVLERLHADERAILGRDIEGEVARTERLADWLAIEWPPISS